MDTIHMNQTTLHIWIIIFPVLPTLVGTSSISMLHPIMHAFMIVIQIFSDVTYVSNWTLFNTGDIFCVFVCNHVLI